MALGPKPFSAEIGQNSSFLFSSALWAQTALSPKPSINFHLIDS